jgi:hypothetical protein
MSVQGPGEPVIFGATDWAQRYGGTRFGVKIRDFGSESGVCAQLWEEVAPNQWNILDAVWGLEVDIANGATDTAMQKILAMVRKWLKAKFGNSTTPPILSNVEKLDREVQKIRFIAGPPPDVLYP